MARQRARRLPAKKSDAAREKDSLLIRSAASLGRVIGSLQRQVRSNTKRVAGVANDAIEALPRLQRVVKIAQTSPGKPKRASKTASRPAASTRRPARARKTAPRKRVARKASSLKK